MPDRPLRRLVVGVVLGAAVLAAAAAVQPAPPAAAQADAPADATVSMKRFAFSPPSTTIRAGGRVTWTYDESVTDLQLNCESLVFQLPVLGACPGHSTTGTAPGGGPAWDSGVHRADGFPYSTVLSQPGRYPYRCTVHADMVGEVVVVASGTSVVTPSVGGGPATPAPGLGGAGGTGGRTPSVPLGDRPELAQSGPPALPLALLGAAGLFVVLMGRRLRPGPGAG